MKDKNITPVRKDFLVFGKPYIGEEEIKEVVSTLRSGWWGTGPKTEEFEDKFRKYVKADYAVSVNSATAGLHLALMMLDLKPGDEVITTPLTWVSTANVIIHSGAVPIFADIDIATWNINPSEIERKITKKTKAIIPVHLHGRPVDMGAIKKLARKYKLAVIEDAAHAIEAKWRGEKIGSIGDMTVFSFYVTKNLATGEGGMVTTNKKRWNDRLRVLRLHGLSRDAYKRYSVKHFTLFQAVEPGFKYNLTDIASSIGIHQLARINDNLKRRKEIWNKYNRAFRHNEYITIPAPIEVKDVHAMHLYGILIDVNKLRTKRNEFVDFLIKMNIGSGVHFPAIHLQQYYRKTYGYKKGDFPNAEFVGDRILSLPLGANLTNQDVEDVINAVNFACEHFSSKIK